MKVTEKLAATVVTGFDVMMFFAYWEIGRHRVITLFIRALILFKRSWVISDYMKFGIIQCTLDCVVSAKEL